MEDNLQEDWTLITGASQGIGKALAFECAKRGMNLFLVALPSSGLEEVTAQISQKYGVNVDYMEIDLTRMDSCHEVYRYSKSRGLNINVLINNAGIGYNGRIDVMPAENVDQMIMLNVRATTMLVHFYLTDLMAMPRAYILNVGSMAAYTPLPGKCIYAASKAYVMFLSKALANELKKSGVSVTSVYPYGVMTNDMVKERINKSGFLAKSAVLEADEVAAVSIGGMLKGKSILIPGKMGKVLFYTGFLIPQGLVLKIMEREFRRAPV
jgi:short-subunit dehydrogenase